MTPYATNSCVHLIKSRKRVEKERDGKRREGREEEEKGEKRQEVRWSLRLIPPLEKKLSTTGLDVSQLKKMCRSI